MRAAAWTSPALHPFDPVHQGAEEILLVRDVSTAAVIHAGHQKQPCEPARGIETSHDVAKGLVVLGHAVRCRKLDRRYPARESTYRRPPEGLQIGAARVVYVQRPASSLWKLSRSKVQSRHVKPAGS